MFSECLLRLIQFPGSNTQDDSNSVGVKLHRPRFNDRVADWVSSKQFTPKFDQITIDFADPVAYTWVGRWEMVQFGGNPGTIAVDGAPARNCYWGYNMMYQGLDFFQTENTVGGGLPHLKMGDKMIVTARLYHAGLWNDGIKPIDALTINLPRPLGNGFLYLNSTMLKKGQLYWELV